MAEFIEKKQFFLRMYCFEFSPRRFIPLSEIKEKNC